MNKRKKLILRGLIFALALVVGIFNIIPVLALSEELINKYSNYQIYFYNAEQCEPGTTEPGGPDEPVPGGEQWDGSCSPMTASRINWVNKYLSPMQTIASKNGLPWEMIPAQVFQESGGGKSEICDHNPLGLKAKKGYPACSNGFAKFNNYEEAFQYYADTSAISKVKNKYPNNPYAAIAYMQSGDPPYYAVCDSEVLYPQCKGHMGEPTPGYVNSVSAIICGIQKWAKSEGIAISPVTWENYDGGSGGAPGESGDPGDGSSGGATYCKKDGEITDPDPDPDPTTLEEYVKAWAWPTYEAGKTEQMPAYAKYMKTAKYKGDCNGNDCGAFVSNIMVASGWDPNYKLGPVLSTQKPYLDANWKKVSADSLKLGDVGVKKTGHHVILYVGDISGFGSKVASASQCDHAPMAGSASADKLSTLNNYTWYRKP